MTKYSDDIARLFSGKNLAFLATTMPDGSPQVSPVWADYEDGYILVNTAEGRIKHRNILADPRVAVAITSHENTTDMVTVRGKVEALIPDPNYENADRLTKKYMGRDRYPFRRPDEKRVVLKIKPLTASGMPILISNEPKS